MPRGLDTARRMLDERRASVTAVAERLLEAKTIEANEILKLVS